MSLKIFSYNLLPNPDLWGISLPMDFPAIYKADHAPSKDQYSMLVTSISQSSYMSWQLPWNCGVVLGVLVFLLIYLIWFQTLLKPSLLILFYGFTLIFLNWTFSHQIAIWLTTFPYFSPNIFTPLFQIIKSLNTTSH